MSTSPAVTTWTIDPTHSGVHFSVRHMVITKVRGSFSKFSGTIALDEQNLAASSVTVEIDASSIETREAQRDGHLKSPDFLDVAAYPTITFRSTAVSGDASSLKVTGDLTIHGVTRSVVLDATREGGGKDPWGNQRVAFSAHTTINREEFGLTWNQVLEAGGVLVGKELHIELDVQAIHKA